MDLRSMKLGFKIGLGFGSLLLFLLIVGLIGTSMLRKVNRDYSVGAMHQVEMEMTAQEIEIHILQVRRNEKDFMARLDRKYIDKLNGNLNLAQQEAETLLEWETESELKDKIETIVNDIITYREGFAKLAQGVIIRGLTESDGLRGSFRTAAHDLEEGINANSIPGGMTLYLTMRRHEKDYMIRKERKYVDRNLETIGALRSRINVSNLSMRQKGNFTALLDTYQRDFLALVNQDAEIETQLSAIKINADRSMDLSDEIAVTIRQMSDVYIESVKQSSETALGAMYIAVVIALILGAGVSLLLTRMITRPVIKAADVARRISENDLTSKPIASLSEDEIGQLSHALDIMSENLNQMLLKVTNSTEQVTTASNQISAASQEMASGAQEQSEQTVEVSASVQQMSAAIVENSQNAHQTAQISARATEKAKEGVEAMRDTRRGMDAIVESSQKTGQIIGSLSSRADQIGNIIQVIEEIADQTNLLALNAAIEAARAGEQGRGFAVVADEVRKLAERTTKATSEITSTIEAIQGDTKNAAESMGSAQQVVSEGQASTTRTEAVLQEIVQSVTQAMDMIQQIATASEEQSSGAEQISRNVGSIQSVTEQSARASEEMAVSAQHLNDEAENLRGLVKRFKIRQT